MSKVIIIPEEELVKRIEELNMRLQSTSKNNQNLITLYRLTLNVYNDIMASCDRVDTADSWENVPGVNDPKEMNNLRPKGVVILKEIKNDDI